MIDTIQEYVTGIHNVAENYRARQKFFINIWNKVAEIETDGKKRRRFRKEFFSKRVRSQEYFCSNLQRECEKILTEIIEPIVTQYSLPVTIPEPSQNGLYGLLCIHRTSELDPADKKAIDEGKLYASECQLKSTGSLKSIIRHNHDIFVTDIFSIINYLKYHENVLAELYISTTDPEDREIMDRFMECSQYCDNWVNVMAKKCLLQDVAHINYMENDFQMLTDDAYQKYWATIYRDIPPDKSIGGGKGRVVDIASAKDPTKFRRHDLDFMLTRSSGEIWIEDRKIKHRDKRR